MKRTLLLVPLLAACSVHHHEVNAPGHVEPRTPPEQPIVGVVEKPEDPGEKMVVLTYGALASGGIGWPEASDAVAAYAVGPEVSLHLGQSERSHSDDGMFVLPQRSLGLNLGWTTLAHPGTGLGPVYGELQYTEVYWLAAGWAYDADDHAHGPQAALGLGPVFLRYTHLFDESSVLTLGVVMKGYQSWVFSR